MYDEKSDKNCKGDEDMSKVANNVKVDLRQSIARSLNDIEKIENGELPKRSDKHMIERVKQKKIKLKQLVRLYHNCRKGGIGTLNLQIDNLTKQSLTKKSLGDRQFEV